ncbi:hypothetical protein [Terrabacter sp. NPDC080008]|uniref:hypothetical protein n=1 Tax=Terrabacter sp. NPDC080008 TaxID=3155176 RepID=UPI00344E7CDF
MTGQPGAAGRPAPAPAPSPETADAVAAAVLAVPGVVRLHGGAFGEAATYFRGRTVQGVQARPGSTTVHVVLAWAAPAQETAALVRAAVTAITHGPVDVVVADIADPVDATHRRVT